MTAVQRLYEQIKPAVYRLDITLDLAAFSFSAVEAVDFELVAATNTLTWHAVGLTVTSALLDGTTATWTTDPETSTIGFGTGSELATGNHTLEVTFTGTIQDSLHGFYRSQYDNGKSTKFMAVTQYEAIHAREGLICIDEPAAKAVFNVGITAREDLTLLSNTPAASRSVTGALQTVTFEATPKMSTYLLAYIAGNLESVQTTTRSGILIRAFATPGQTEQLAFALDAARRSLEFYESYFAIPYPLPKLDMVAIPDFGAGAMENWGLVTYRETDLLIDEVKSSLPNRQRVAVVVAHELAHQWFGNLVTMSWWNDLWLNESFASWAEGMTIEHLFPEWENWQDFVTSYGAYARELDANSHTHSVEVAIEDPAGIDEIFDAISYYKGQSLLVMLEDYIGREAFRAGLQKYLTAHSYSNTVTTDLWAALGAASGMPVARLMQAWTAEAGYPVVTARTTDAVVTLTQERFLGTPGKEVPSNWQIPVTSTSGNVANQQVLMQPDGHLTPGPGILKLNSDQRGFYRVRYEAALTRTLQNEIMSLSPVDRYGLISDQFALSSAGMTSAVSALELLDGISDCSDYPTWMAALTGLGSIKELYGNDDATRGKIDSFGVQLTRAIVRKLGWEPGVDEVPSKKILRVFVLGAAGEYGNSEVVAEAQQRFAARRVTVIPADFEGVIYGIAARKGNASVFDELLVEYRTSTQPQQQARIRSALTRVSGPELVTRALEFSMSPEVRAQDTLDVLGRMMAHPVTARAAWDYMTSQWDELNRRYADGGHMLERLPEYASDGFSSRDEATTVETFFLADHPMAATLRPARQAIERINAKAAFKERDDAAIQTWLQSR